MSHIGEHNQLSHGKVWEGQGLGLDMGQLHLLDLKKHIGPCHLHIFVEILNGSVS